MQLHLKEPPISTKLQWQLGKHFTQAGRWSVLLEKRMFICEETLWLQLWHGLTLVNTSVLFNEILYDPVAFDNAQTSDLLSANVANISHWYFYCEIWQTDQICHEIVMFPRKDLSSQIIVCLFFFQLLFLFKCGKKNTNIVPFLPCLYLFQSVNSVVLTPLHGLGKLSLQQTAIPRSITGLFRSSHRGLLAKKTLLILFSAGQREERGWFAENLNNNTFQHQSPPYCGGRVCVPWWPSEVCCWGRLRQGAPQVTSSSGGSGVTGKIVFLPHVATLQLPN